ncbi:MAG: hypothetical protein ACP5HU_12835 [Phycisphaerae bacterium]
MDACTACVAGQTRRAAQQLRSAAHLADGAFLAGFLAIDAKRLDEAERYLKLARTKHAGLGRHFQKYGLQVELALPTWAGHDSFGMG